MMPLEQIFCAVFTVYSIRHFVTICTKVRYFSGITCKLTTPLFVCYDEVNEARVCEKFKKGD
jgi:hypothetical protein